MQTLSDDFGRIFAQENVIFAEVPCKILYDGRFRPFRQNEIKSEYIGGMIDCNNPLDKISLGDIIFTAHTGPSICHLSQCDCKTFHVFAYGRNIQLKSTMAGTSAVSSEMDRLSLLEFKAKITDDPLGIMRLWNDTTHFCEWYGIICGSRHQRVTKLKLSSLKLAGSISPYIGNLSFLRVLQLQNNSFIHQIPKEVSHLRRLQILYLHNNSLSGEIPPNVSSCSNLRWLALDYNKLEGEIPVEIGSLSKLELFYARNNNLMGALPKSLGNLTSLRVLSLTFNKLVGSIPTTLGSLSQLGLLNIAGNFLSGKLPSSFFNLSSLETLDIGNNQLLGSLPSTLFHTLPNLQWVSLNSNQFYGPIPFSLSNASNLGHLDFSANNFTGKVPSLGIPSRLTWFSIYRNKLGSGVGARDDLNFFCSLVNANSLQHLLVSDNNFGGVLPGCISNLSSQLVLLDISDNFIAGGIPPGIGNLISLDVLTMFNNSISGTIPPTIGNMKNLAILELSGNNLSGHIPSSIGNLSKLIRLGLSSNNLEGTIPSSLHTCTSLQILYLYENKLTGTIPPRVLTIPSLSVGLDLSHNQLNGLLPVEVGQLRSLDILDVSGNMLSGEVPSSLGKCTSLVQLYLGQNNFRGSIPSSLSSLRGLQYLDISSNNFSGPIPDFLASFNLTMLNLSFNHLEGLVPSKGVFKNSNATLLKGNQKLCGGLPDFHLPACRTSLVRKKRRMSTRAKVIIAIAVGIAFVALMILVLSLLRLRRKQSQREVDAPPSDNPPLPFVSYVDLHRATNGFSEENLIGAGSFGYVYKGVIGAEERVVAVKVLDLKRVGAIRSFAAECEALRNMRHRNLVKIVTVCSGVDQLGNDFKALVYEFMPNRSLEEWLYPALDEQVPQRKLDLLQTLIIAIDVASLLEYAHQQLGTPLVHCDIKPSNILLDDQLSGRVSDFGLAKFLYSSMQSSSSYGVRGTVGYAPPEYGLGSQVSTQGDVYSYGILLLQMLTGRRPTDEMFKEGLTLHLYAKLGLQRNVLDILDPTIQQDLLDSMDQVWDASLNTLIRNPRRAMGSDTKVIDGLASVVEIGVACSFESPPERMEISVAAAKLCSIKDNLTKIRSKEF